MIISNKNGFLEFSEDKNDDGEDVLILDIISVQEKRRGTGTELMNQFLKIADSRNLQIELCAYPQDDSISLPTLVDFYESFGFDINYDDGHEVLMSRKQ